jgi:hypothetical protein
MGPATERESRGESSGPSRATREQEPQRMPLALARRDALERAAVESNRGVVVKMVGDARSTLLHLQGVHS